MENTNPNGIHIATLSLDKAKRKKSNLVVDPAELTAEIQHRIDHDPDVKGAFTNLIYSMRQSMKRGDNPEPGAWRKPEASVRRGKRKGQ